jgi:hypothetical protein
MVSASHFCAGPRVGHRAGRPDVIVGAMTPAVTALPAAMSSYLEELMNGQPLNCLKIGTAGEAIRVLVYPEDDATKKLIEAVGTLSNDGKSFSVVVTREDGAQQNRHQF